MIDNFWTVWIKCPICGIVYFSRIDFSKFPLFITKKCPKNAMLLVKHENVTKYKVK